MGSHRKQDQVVLSQRGSGTALWRMTKRDTVPHSPTAIGRWFYRASMLAALAIGGLQMFHVRGGILTNYGADLLGTAWLYAMTRLGLTIVQRGRPTSAATAAAVIFLLCTMSELGQREHVVPGRYDPLDIVAFALAIGACLGVERFFGPFVASLPSHARSPERSLHPS